jgi:hypothetical protein
VQRQSCVTCATTDACVKFQACGSPREFGHSQLQLRFWFTSVSTGTAPWHSVSDRLASVQHHFQLRVRRYCATLRRCCVAQRRSAGPLGHHCMGLRYFYSCTHPPTVSISMHLSPLSPPWPAFHTLQSYFPMHTNSLWLNLQGSTQPRYRPVVLLPEHPKQEFHSNYVENIHACRIINWMLYCRGSLFSLKCLCL